MSRAREIVPQTYKLDGGLNLDGDASMIEDNQLQVCINFNIKGKKLVKRFGMVDVPLNLETWVDPDP